MTALATFNGQTIAESDHTIVVEGNRYFPVNHDAKGKRRFVRQGGYTSQESLDAGIRAYALT